MQPGSIPGEGTNDNHKGNTTTMTNTQLLTTADRALKDAARVFAAVADVRDPAGVLAVEDVERSGLEEVDVVEVRERVADVVLVDEHAERLIEVRELGVDPKRYPPRAVHSKISGAKNQLIDADMYAETAAGPFEEVVAEARHEAGKRVRQVEEEAREEADRKAKKIITIAIERLAGDCARSGPASSQRPEEGGSMRRGLPMAAVMAVLLLVLGGWLGCGRFASRRRLRRLAPRRSILVRCALIVGAREHGFPRPGCCGLPLG